MPLLRGTPLRRRHDSGVEHQAVEPGLLLLEGRGGGGDGFEVGQVQLESLEAARGGGCWEGGPDGGNGGGDFGAVTGGEVDGGRAGVEHLGELEADARGGAGDDVDAGLEGGEGGFGEGGGGGNICDRTDMLI